MPTSTWINLEFCVSKFWEAFGKYKCKSFLDVGPGFGRWGLLAREMGDIIRGRTDPKNWQVTIDAIEIYKPYVDNYSLDRLYSKIVIEDVFLTLPKLERTYDIVFFGDVLEHLERWQVVEIVKLTLNKVANKIIFINIPLGKDWSQGNVGGNVAERHKSIWELSDIKSLVENPQWSFDMRIFYDFKQRPYLTLYGVKK